MSRNNLFYIFLALTLVFLLGAVYYAIPGVHHVLALHNPDNIQIKHIIGLVGVAIVCLLVALVNRPKKTETQVTEVKAE